MDFHRLRDPEWGRCVLIDSISQAELAAWLCGRLGMAHTSDLVCIGNRGADGEIIGVVGYEGFNGASIQMHTAGEGNWLTRQFLWAIFHYPFVVCKAKVAIAPVASNNARALRLNERVGFVVEHVIADGHPDGDLILMTMRPSACRFVELGEHDGKADRIAANAG